MINVVQHDEVYNIHFRYDPQLIELVKLVPGRRWVPEAKVWTIPKDKLGFLLNNLSGTDYENAVQIESGEYLGVNASLDKSTLVPQIDISDVKLYVQQGMKIYEHQKDTLRYAIHRDNVGIHSGFLLADEPGLGKTLSVINLALYRKQHDNYKHCLVICCINTSKYNWSDDIDKHTNHEFEPYILGSRQMRNGDVRIGSSQDKLDDLLSLTKYACDSSDAQPLPYFLILNIESLRYRVGRKYPIADKIAELCNNGQINMIAIDEIHKNCSPTSMQGKQLLAIKKATGSKVEWIPMTGTPITKSPLDCYTPLKLIDAHDYKSFYTWAQNFAVYGGYGDKEIIGYKNIPQLKRMLQNNMIRRLKEDVLDLPEKIHIVDYVENSPYQKRLYNQVVQGLKSSASKIQSSLNPLAQFIRLRQVNGSPEIIDADISVSSKDYPQKNAKLCRLLELVDQYCGDNQKVVIFSNWVEPLRTVYKYVSKKYKTCCFTGTMNEADREKHKRAFLTNPEYLIMLGTIGALGTAHTLTCSHIIIFLDEPWNATDKEQAEDRCHRISTTDNLTIHTLITKDTVDERVHNILYTKHGVAKYVVDDELDVSKHPELLDLLLLPNR